MPRWWRCVDEVHEVLGRPVAAGRGEVAGDLVAPRAVEGVLHHRHELHVGEAHLLAVVGEPRGDLPVAQGAVSVARGPHPRAEVDLVDRHRRVEGVASPAGPHPLRVVPGVVEVPHHRPGLRRGLGVNGVGVGLVRCSSRPCATDVVLVDRALPQAGHEALPDPRVPGGPQGVALPVPPVEVPDHRTDAAFGAQTPKWVPACPWASTTWEPEHAVHPIVGPLVEEVKVVGAEKADVVTNRVAHAVLQRLTRRPPRATGGCRPAAGAPTRGGCSARSPARRWPSP